MYTPCKLCRKDAVGRAPLNSRGLGEEYSTISKTGMMVQTVSSPLTQGYDPLGISLVTKIPGVPGSVGKTIEKIGGGSPLAPLIGAPAALTLDVFTLGLMRLPGISKLFGGMFKKATHFGDCMKFETDDNYVMNSLGRGIIIYPLDRPSKLDVEAVLPEISQEYYRAHAKKVSTNVEVTQILNRDEVLINNAMGNRVNVAKREFLSLVRGSGILEVRCAVFAQSKGENMGISYTWADIKGFMGSLQEQASVKEYGKTITNMQNIRVDSIKTIANFLSMYGSIVEQRKVITKESRQEGILTKKGFEFPKGVIGIRSGALILTPGVSTNKIIKMGVIGSKK